MRVHVIGGGLAGLSAALALADSGRPVTLYEAGSTCGGRCRSYDDRVLGTRLDNGNHLLLSGNRDAFAFLKRVGTVDTLGGPETPVFPFVDLTTSERWTLRLGRGRVPWWMFAPSRRVPGTRLAEHGALLRLLRAGPRATVADCFSAGPLAERLLRPLAIAILNTMPERGSATLLSAVFRDSLMRGGKACIPAFPRVGLSESFVDPTLATLRSLGADIRLGWRVQSMERKGDRVVRLTGPEGGAPVGPGEQVVLATPAPVAATLLPGTPVPATHESIINLHFRTDLTTDIAPIADSRFVGLVGSLAEWIFLKEGVISVTISAANRFNALDPDAITASIWRDVKTALGLSTHEPMPPARLVREKRATFEATPETDARRASPKTSVANVTLAGDWTATGLPATIEGAIRSGRTASRLILSQA